MDIQAIRRANLLLLLNECARELGTDRGSAAELARRTGVTAPFISQFKNERLHQGGRARALGDDTARKLERGMAKSHGWMDVVHEAELSEQESAHMATFRALTPEQRDLIAMQAAEYARLNTGGAAQSPAERKHLNH